MFTENANRLWKNTRKANADLVNSIIKTLKTEKCLALFTRKELKTIISIYMH